MPAALVLLVVSYIFDHPLTPVPLPPYHHRHDKKKDLRDELIARAKANDYQRICTQIKRVFESAIMSKHTRVDEH
jgi:hypothetical protein